MLYTCSPARAGGAMLKAARKTGRGGTRPVTVDIHCHVLTPEADALMQPAFRPETDALFKFANAATREVNRQQGQTIRAMLTSVETRLADMESLGIDIQAISPAPSQYYYWADADLTRRAARRINERIAEIVAGNPDRFVGMGTVPLQAPDLAVAELEHLVKKLGLRGVEICTDVAGEELSGERFRPFFAKAEELGILVFMHPSGYTDGGRLADHYFINVIGNPLASTVAVSHLIFGGVLDAYPRLKMCVAHGGGFLPAYSGRMDHAHRARSDCRRLIRKPPTRYLKKLYFDTVVFTDHQLDYLVRQYGSDHILLGSDYPYDMASPDPVGHVMGTRGLSGAEKAAVLGGNAARLLKIRLRKPGNAKPKAKGKSRRRAR
ncbi:MAG TPA: amidohydrolase family protein [Stellaceae bacterium]|nr:amidohydrolase family protein [Stellaceae bacterium]